jgi:hypothetical protein
MLRFFRSNKTIQSIKKVSKTCITIYILNITIVFAIIYRSSGIKFPNFLASGIDFRFFFFLLLSFQYFFYYCIFGDCVVCLWKVTFSWRYRIHDKLIDFISILVLNREDFYRSFKWCLLVIIILIARDFHLLKAWSWCLFNARWWLIGLIKNHCASPIDSCHFLTGFHGLIRAVFIV